MSLVSYALKNRAVILVLILMISIGGFLSYGKIGRLEDPQFTIKQAVIVTQYPGATAEEVEMEITDPLETAIQQLKQLHEVRSISRAVNSSVSAEVCDKFCHTSCIPKTCVILNLFLFRNRLPRNPLRRLEKSA